MKKPKQHLYDLDAKLFLKKYHEVCRPLKNRKRIIRKRNDNSILFDYPSWENFVLETLNKDMHKSETFEKYLNLRIRQNESNYDISKAILVPCIFAMATNVIFAIISKVKPIVDDSGNVITSNNNKNLFFMLFIFLTIIIVLTNLLSEYRDYKDLYNDILEIIKKRNSKLRKDELNVSKNVDDK